MLDHGKEIKRASKQKWDERDYHVQERKNVPQTSAKISCAINQFPALKFCGPQVKTNEVRGLSKHYWGWGMRKNDQIILDPKLSNGKCVILQIHYECVKYITML